MAWLAAFAVLAGTFTAVWFTFGRAMLKVAHLASEMPIGPGLRLLDDPWARLDGARVTETVIFGADVLVGFDERGGSWLERDVTTSRMIGLRDVDGQSGQVRLDGAARDPRARRHLNEWRSLGSPITVVLTRDGQFALLDVASRQAVLGECLGSRPLADPSGSTAPVGHRPDRDRTTHHQRRRHG